MRCRQKRRAWRSSWTILTLPWARGCTGCSSTCPRIPESLRRESRSRTSLRVGSRKGRNDFGKIGYGGPCPPPGKPHRYFFKLYALDAKLNLKADATKADVERAMKGRILAQAELVGKYGR